MANLSQFQLSLDGTIRQARTIHDGAPGRGRSLEARKLGLQRRRAKGLDDVPGSVGRGKKKGKKKTTKKKTP